MGDLGSFSGSIGNGEPVFDDVPSMSPIVGRRRLMHGDGLERDCRLGRHDRPTEGTVFDSDLGRIDQEFVTRSKLVRIRASKCRRSARRHRIGDAGSTGRTLGLACGVPSRDPEYETKRNVRRNSAGVTGVANNSCREVVCGKLIGVQPKLA
ncbi:hypothetical protein EVAR_29369_1 [Eumeta japonica]|uniref:Uncharacterized protein n=1 Tax=Eumeta variegata TaxID=151549 RepID=A0A4C1WJV4_EUMVA|nr:hypothetical protein EVAR_29369_1 [Eumeta japonica]